MADADENVPGEKVWREILQWKRLQPQAVLSRYMSRCVILLFRSSFMVRLLAEWKIAKECNATLDHNGKQLQALYSPGKGFLKEKWVTCYYKGKGGKKISSS